jgi:putative FmdB family regulatory protein
VLIAMPIYEYECRKCGHRFDVMQSYTDPAVTSCRRDGCRGKVRKVLSPPTVIFKGSGFYCTDYGRKGCQESCPKKAEEMAKTVESTKEKTAVEV